MIEYEKLPKRQHIPTLQHLKASLYATIVHVAQCKLYSPKTKETIRNKKCVHFDKQPFTVGKSRVADN